MFLLNFLLLWQRGVLALDCNAGSVDKTKVPKSFGPDVTESTLRKVWPNIHSAYPTVNFWDWYKFFTTYAAYFNHGKSIANDIYQVWPISLDKYGDIREVDNYDYTVAEELGLSWNEMVFDQLNIPIVSLVAANIFYDVEVGLNNYFHGGWNTFSINFGGANKTRWDELEAKFEFQEHLNHDNFDLLVVVDDSSLIADDDFQEIKSFIENIETVANSASLDISVHPLNGGSFHTFQAGPLDLSSFSKSSSQDRNVEAVFDNIYGDFTSARSDAAKYVLLIITGTPTDDVSRIQKNLPGHTQLIVLNIGGQHVTLDGDTTKNMYASTAADLNSDNHRVENILFEVTQGVIYLSTVSGDSWSTQNIRLHANSNRQFSFPTAMLGEITTEIRTDDGSFAEATILAGVSGSPSYAFYELERNVNNTSPTIIKIGPTWDTTYFFILNENDEDLLVDFTLDMRTPVFGFYTPDIDISRCNIHEYCSADGTCDCISTYYRTRNDQCTFSQFIKRPELDTFVCDLKDGEVEFYINLTDYIPPVTDPRYEKDIRGFCFVDNSTISGLITKLELAGSSNNTFGNSSCACSAWLKGNPGELQKYNPSDCPSVMTKEFVQDENGLLKEVYSFGVGYDDATIETGFGKIMVQPGARWKLSCDVKRASEMSLGDDGGPAEITYEIESVDGIDLEDNLDEINFDFAFFATTDLEGNKRIGEEPLEIDQDVYIQAQIRNNPFFKLFTSYCEITVTTNGTDSIFQDIVELGCVNPDYEDSFLRPDGFLPRDSGVDKFILRPIVPSGFKTASVDVACTVLACPDIGPGEPFCAPGPTCGDIYSAQTLRSLKRGSNKPHDKDMSLQLTYVPKNKIDNDPEDPYDSEDDDDDQNSAGTAFLSTFILCFLTYLL